MLTFDSWHKEGLSFDELPTMRDMLLASDPALVADELHRRRVRASLSSGERPPSLARVWDEAEAAMGEMLGTPARRPDCEGVLMAATTASWDPIMEDMLLVSTGANLVRRHILPLYARYLGDGPVPVEFAGEVPPNGWAGRSSCARGRRCSRTVRGFQSACASGRRTSSSRTSSGR